MSKQIEQYHASLKKDFEHTYVHAIKARTKGLDPSSEVEIIPAQDVAARVQGIVGPAGVATGIRAHINKRPDMIAYEVAKEVLDGKYAKTDDERSREKLIEQSVRTAVAILTEGVLVAPKEGITRVKIRKNPDGSEYLAMYFSGPIRAAGGTVAALSVVFGDIARQKFGISGFRPTESEIERYVEEVNLYDSRAIRLQYMPKDEEIRTILRNCPIMITGDPTEKRLEVAVHKGLERMESDRVRGGMCLVISETCQKSSKVLKFTKRVGLDWGWLEGIVKVGKSEGGKIVGRGEEIYLDDVAAGRPILAYPSRKGAFRLCYGRCRTSGIAGKAIHPATMELLDEFIVIGTQMKVERPGKGCVAAPCDSIEGPFVKLADGSVRKIRTYAESLKVKKDVRSIIALGDLLVPFGDFAKANHPLLPSAWCKEWWALELREKKGKWDDLNKIPNASEAFKISEKHKVPLYPDYTYSWHDITSGQARELADWLVTGKLKYDFFTLKEFRVQSSPTKAVLEALCVPHEVQEGDIILDADNTIALLRSLSLLKGRGLSLDKFNEHHDAKLSPLELVNVLAGVEIRPFAPTYLGARMGRPEKAKHREMRPAPHVLFPIGDAGGKTRSILRATSDKAPRQPSVDLSRRKCDKCSKLTPYITCPTCSSETIEEHICPKCGRVCMGAKCSCGTETMRFDERPINVKELLKKAITTCGYEPKILKGVGNYNLRLRAEDSQGRAGHGERCQDSGKA